MKVAKISKQLVQKKIKETNVTRPIIWLKPRREICAGVESVVFESDIDSTPVAVRVSENTGQDNDEQDMINILSEQSWPNFIPYYGSIRCNSSSILSNEWPSRDARKAYLEENKLNFCSSDPTSYDQGPILGEAKFTKKLYDLDIFEYVPDNWQSVLKKSIDGKIQDIDIRTSVFLQVCSVLYVTQSTFDFEHNDLHLKNLVFKPTNKKWQEFEVDGKIWQVPLYGWLAIIIDFGYSRMYDPLAKKWLIGNSLKTMNPRQRHATNLPDWQTLNEIRTWYDVAFLYKHMFNTTASSLDVFMALHGVKFDDDTYRPMSIKIPFTPLDVIIFAADPKKYILDNIDRFGLDKMNIKL